MSETTLQFKKLKEFGLGEYLPIETLSTVLDEKYCKEYYPESTLVTDETANVYKNVKCSKITKKVFDKRADNEYRIIIRTSCVSKKIEGLVVVGADIFKVVDPSNPSIVTNHYAGGVYISLDGGKTYTLFDKDPENVPVANAKICGICSIREEQNFDRDYPDVTGYKQAAAFICGNNNGELFEMIVYVTESGELLTTYAHKLYYMSGRYVSNTYAELTANEYSISSLIQQNIGTIYSFDVIDGKYVLATRTGIWAYYVEQSENPLHIEKRYDNCAAYTVTTYNNKVYSASISEVEGMPGYIISTTDGLRWIQEYTIKHINNLNRLLMFDNKLVGVGQNNYVLTYDKAEWKEMPLEIDGDFNSNSTTSLYISKLRKERCFMASNHGLYMSDTLTKWTNINNDSSIIGDINQGHSLFLYGDYLYLCGRGITQLEDALKPLATIDECISQEVADEKYLAKSDAQTTYLTKTSANELYMDAVLSSHEVPGQHEYYTWTIEDEHLTEPLVIKFEKLPSECLAEGIPFNATINDETVTWQKNDYYNSYYNSKEITPTSYRLIYAAFNNNTIVLPDGSQIYGIKDKVVIAITGTGGTHFPANGQEYVDHKTGSKTIISKVPFNDATLSVIYDENDVTRKVAKGICLGDISNSNVYKLYIDNGEIKTQQM